MLRTTKFSTIFLLTLIIAACAAPPPPPPPPPPPLPVTFATPPVPLPPLGASATYIVPGFAADGKRDTINRDIGPLQTLWHFRAAYNVAGLTCVSGSYATIADDYNAFLKKHESALRRANDAVESKYRRENGSDYRRVRDTDSTRVYNYYSFPPVKNEFCQTIQRLGKESLVIDGRDDLTLFASSALPELDGIYERFYAQYEAYQNALADWQARYGNNASENTATQNTGAGG